MNSTTTREEFDQLVAAGHRVVPVIRQLFADGETPVGVYRKLAKANPGTFLLESADQGGIWSRFSFVGVASFGVLTQHDAWRRVDRLRDAARAHSGRRLPDGSARSTRASQRALEDVRASRATLR